MSDRRMSLQDKKGFTMIELVVLLAVLLALGGIAAGFILPKMQELSDSRSEKLSQSLGSSLSTYVADQLSKAKKIVLSDTPMTETLFDLSSYTNVIVINEEGHFLTGSAESPFVLFGKEFYMQLKVSYEVASVDDSMDFTLTIKLDGKTTYKNKLDIELNALEEDGIQVIGESGSFSDCYIYYCN